MRDHADILKDALLEDYRYRAEALRNSEQTGETRINIFLGLVTFLVGGVATLSSQQYGPRGDTLKLIILITLALLFVVGWMTLLRLIIRNEHTDASKRDLDHIRQVFKDHFDHAGILVGYYPLGAPSINADTGSDPVEATKDREHDGRKFGGFSHFMSVINSLLFAGFVGCLLLPFDGTFSLGSVNTLGALIVALIAGAISVNRHAKYVEHRKNEAELDREAGEPTHAGGVVYRNIADQVEYMLIPPKNSNKNERVLPKGHIEKHEGHMEAALREVREETGIVARCVGFLGVVEYVNQDASPARNHEPIKPKSDKPRPFELVRAKYYLMECLFATPLHDAHSEIREENWQPYEKALDLLSHPEGKHVLQLAEITRKSLMKTAHQPGDLCR